MSAEYDYDQDNNFIDEDDDDDIKISSVHSKDIARQLEKEEKKASGGAGGDDDLFATEEGSEGRNFMAVKAWVGSIHAPTTPAKFNPAAPEEKLKIEWAYGYRGFDSRSNVCINSKGQLVYPCAGLAVVYDPTTNTQKHYLGHDDDVTCLAQHPTNLNLIVSGQNATVSHLDRKGKPPHICVWDSTDFTKTWIIKCDQKDRCVRSVGFSSDGKFVAAVMNDDNHTVKVYDWENKKLLASTSGDVAEIFFLRWNHKDNTEFVTVGKRHCKFWKFDGSRLTGKKAMMGSKYPWQTFYSVAFSEKGYACAGAYDGSIYVFIGGSVAKRFAGIHEGRVLALDWWQGGLISGGSDGAVHVLDRKLEKTKSFKFEGKISAVYMLNQQLAVGTVGSSLYLVDNWDTANSDGSSYKPFTQGHWDGETWGLAISPDGEEFVTSGDDNKICVWSTSKKSLLRKGTINPKKGQMPKIAKAATTGSHPPNQCARAAAWSPDGQYIAVGTNSGELNVYDARTLELVKNVDLNEYGKRNVTGQQQNWIQELKYSPSGATLAVGTHGSVIVLLNTKTNAVKQVLKPHASFITHIDWSEDGTAMQSNCGAYELLFHNIDESDLKNSKHNGSSSAFKNTAWATQTCCFGWSVQGIFQEGMDGTDVNACDANPARNLLVTGDDYGNVNLFRYPALKGATPLCYEGHSSHVPCVRFSKDGQRVYSTGGHDKAVIQWLVARK